MEINYNLPKKGWMDVPVELKKGFFCYGAIKKGFFCYGAKER